MHINAWTEYKLARILAERRREERAKERKSRVGAVIQQQHQNALRDHRRRVRNAHSRVQSVHEVPEDQGLSAPGQTSFAYFVPRGKGKNGPRAMQGMIDGVTTDEGGFPVPVTELRKGGHRGLRTSVSSARRSSAQTQSPSHGDAQSHSLPGSPLRAPHVPPRVRGSRVQLHAGGWGRRGQGGARLQLQRYALHHDHDYHDHHSSAGHSAETQHFAESQETPYRWQGVRRQKSRLGSQDGLWMHVDTGGVTGPVQNGPSFVARPRVFEKLQAGGPMSLSSGNEGSGAHPAGSGHAGGADAVAAQSAPGWLHQPHPPSNPSTQRRQPGSGTQPSGISGAAGGGAGAGAGESGISALLNDERVAIAPFLRERLTQAVDVAAREQHQRAAHRQWLGVNKSTRPKAGKRPAPQTRSKPAVPAGRPAVGHSSSKPAGNSRAMVLERVRRLKMLYKQGRQQQQDGSDVYAATEATVGDSDQTGSAVGGDQWSGAPNPVHPLFPPHSTSQQSQSHNPQPHSTSQQSHNPQPHSTSQQSHNPQPHSTSQQSHNPRPHSTSQQPPGMVSTEGMNRNIKFAKNPFLPPERGDQTGQDQPEHRPPRHPQHALSQFTEPESVPVSQHAHQHAASAVTPLRYQEHRPPSPLLPEAKPAVSPKASPKADGSGGMLPEAHKSWDSVQLDAQIKELADWTDMLPDPDDL